MSDLNQLIFNWAVASIGTLAGFLLNVVWQAVKDLQRADKELAAKVSGIEVLVAGDYVRKDEFASAIHGVFSKLDRIEDKLDGKMDKGAGSRHSSGGVSGTRNGGLV